MMDEYQVVSRENVAEVSTWGNNCALSSTSIFLVNALLNQELFGLAADLEKVDEFEKAERAVMLASELQAITDDFFKQDEGVIAGQPEEFKESFANRIDEVVAEFGELRFFDYVVNRDKVRIVKALNEMSTKIDGIEFIFESNPTVTMDH